MESPRKLKIAISGGGLAGAALANSLSRLPHLHVDIYESASEFSERGQGIGMAINAQRALSRLVPQSEELFTRAGYVTMKSSRVTIGSGLHAGTKVIDVAEEHPGRMLQRAALLHELLEPVSRSTMHTNKKLVSIDEQTNDLLLTFEDGTTITTDALIGADGISGFVRSHVLGSDHGAVKPVHAGWAGVMNLVPIAKAQSKLGAEVLQQNRQYGWMGENGIMIHDSIMDGKMVQCIGTSVDRNPSEERRKHIDRDYLETSYSAWEDGPIARQMIDLLLDQDSPAVYEQWEHVNAPTYTKGLVCVMGDAAHAMTPWQGSGAATALEDAVILSTLLAQVDSPDQLRRAFQVYDAVRRPRSQQIAESSRKTGRILSGIDENIGLDPIKMHDALKDRWAFIHDFDLDGHINDALTMLHASG
ncbi:FAD/NAD(P)-binding domain-containing protein [Lophiostoma macrostomum CBS 122681]|uniref:FAD/NAD(P)-binding domain-containing protein n=1 Tax=Lophiostoma macrostomum CBS 122681 TaxID=1314788 RepID=A0A6A6SK76_9PLEO|nr:FAD/NAD(P)-binding domain-containing protein [Lophiostoma macrostomum CBS 122681]